MEKDYSDVIEINNLEVFYHVGVPDWERSKPQRLLLTIKIYRSFEKCAISDSIEDTIDYQMIVDGLKFFGENKSWKLIEKLACDIADWILNGFSPDAVEVEVKKFIFPETQFISVKVTRQK